MSQTKLTIDKDKFRINGKLTYSEIPTVKPQMHGLLMNARFIQGVFDSKNRAQFHRYGKTFDPQQNTDALIAALPRWYEKGLRAITVGMQGGGACFTIPGEELQNKPFSLDGTWIDPAYLKRLYRILEACDRLGMAVIVSYFYGFNAASLQGAAAVIRIVESMTRYLRDTGFANIVIEIANEHNVSAFSSLPILHEPQGIVALIHLAKQIAPNLAVGCSGAGGYLHREVCQASDIVLIHGNGESRSQLYNHIRRAKEYAGEKPIVINEDSQAIGQLQVCEETCCSWGYYNNMTKQEPPVDWGITRGEDAFFAWRMADMLGIAQPEIAPQEQYYFQGFEPQMHHHGIRFPRVACLYPEKVNYVRFYQNGELIYTCYDESFTCGFCSNWKQDGFLTRDGDVWEAEIVLRDGKTLRLTQKVKNI